MYKILSATTLPPQALIQKILTLVHAVETQQKTKEQAILEIKDTEIAALTKPYLHVPPDGTPYIQGECLSSSVGSGIIVRDTEDLATQIQKYWPQKVVFVTSTLDPSDSCLLSKLAGVICLKGSESTHGVILAKNGALPMIKVTETEYDMLQNGAEVTLQGNTIYKGLTPVVECVGENGQVSWPSKVDTFISWLKSKHIDVYANAESPRDVALSAAAHAQGIGYVRSEHLLYVNPEALLAFQKYLLTDSKDEKKEALHYLTHFFTETYADILNKFTKKKVVIRFLDPPASEFFPERSQNIELLASQLKISPSLLRKKIEALKGSNPDLGQRGAKLLLAHLDLLDMHMEAVLGAAPPDTIPTVSVPMVESLYESELLFLIMQQTAGERPFNYVLNVEIPNLCEEIKRDIPAYLKGITFSTNDFTSYSLGQSRDEGQRNIDIKLKALQDRKISLPLPINPFKTLIPTIQDSICTLATTKNPTISIGIGGEQAVDPVFLSRITSARSTEAPKPTFYVSCSPHRILPALLLAKQAEFQK